MNDPLNDELMRLSLRREMSPDEELRVEAFLATHPELRADWEENAAVGRALGDLRDAPVSSNFTARVLSEIEVEERTTSRRTAEIPLWLRWRELLRPRVSWAALVVVAAALAGYHYRDAKRTELARDLRAMSETLAIVSDPKILQDFDAINQLRQVSPVGDDEILVALQ